MTLQHWLARLKNIPYLLTPPIFSVLRSKWRDRDRELPDIANHELYTPTYSPWLGQGEWGALRERVENISLVSSDRLWILYRLAQNACLQHGDFVECGVYKGGTANLLATLVKEDKSRKLHLFDTFAGMPETDCSVDKHRKGDFADTSLQMVKRNVDGGLNTVFHKGYIPDTFGSAQLGDISLLHVDLDIYKSITDTLTHCYPKVVPGGIIVFDDYGFESCYGARLAVDHFFHNKPEQPICLSTGQAIVLKAQIQS